MSITQPVGVVAATLPQGTWTVDPADSEIAFATRTIFGLMPVRGTFQVHDGMLVVSDDGGAAGSMRVDAQSVRTGLGQRDRHLRSPEFFLADEYPHMEFVLAQIRSVGAGALEFSGGLEIRERHLALASALSVHLRTISRMELTTELEINHGAAGLGWVRAGLIRPEIRVIASIVLERRED